MLPRLVGLKVGSFGPAVSHHYFTYTIHGPTTLFLPAILLNFEQCTDYNFLLENTTRRCQGFQNFQQI